eukprot:SAG22_NODE_260_length_13403_cov_57.915589_6_plen_81_part_00
MVARGSIAADPRRSARKALAALDVIRAKRYEDEQGGAAVGAVRSVGPLPGAADSRSPAGTNAPLRLLRLDWMPPALPCPA